MNGITTTGGRLNVATAVNSCTVPYYTLSVAPAEQTIIPGLTGRYTVTITPCKAYAGPVTMSASDLPAGVTAKFEPAVAAVNGTPVTSTLTLTVPVSSASSVSKYGHVAGSACALAAGLE